uniref:Uncharacterized protein n=1 Tax=Stomoxys calcitrans TaxID=35570 RepID=A0A1I8P721_STOCA
MYDDMSITAIALREATQCKSASHQTLAKSVGSNPIPCYTCATSLCRTTRCQKEHARPTTSTKAQAPTAPPKKAMRPNASTRQKSARSHQNHATTKHQHTPQRKATPKSNKVEIMVRANNLRIPTLESSTKLFDSIGGDQVLGDRVMRYTFEFCVNARSSPWTSIRNYIKSLSAKL